MISRAKPFILVLNTKKLSQKILFICFKNIYTKNLIIKEKIKGTHLHIYF